MLTESLPESWPVQYNLAASTDDECNHWMRWDDESELYRCIRECGKTDESPPEKALRDPDADEPVELWVCMPCFLMNPANPGCLQVPLGKHPESRVWCPWCSDAMEPAEEYLGEDEIEEVRHLVE